MRTPDTGPSAVKAAARAQAQDRRRSLDPPDPQALARMALDFLHSIPGLRRVASYVSYGTEPGTEALNAALADAGFEVLVPRVRGAELDWCEAGTASTVSSMGISEPTGPAVPLLPVRAMLIPALAVTTAGERLGKGGGYYDRVLGSLSTPRPLVAAIVGDHDVVESLPTQDHDRRVDAIITPTRVLRCAQD